MNSENKQNTNWEMPGNIFSSRTIRQFTSVMQRIASFISFNSKWLNASLNSRYVQFEKEGKNFHWIDRLVNRLESPAALHVPDFQRNWYESARSVKYKWYDPRHWLNSVLQIDEEDNDADKPEPEQLVDSRDEPSSFNKVYRKQSVASKIAGKYLKGLASPAGVPEFAVNEQPPVNIAARIQDTTGISRDLNKPVIEFQPGPAELIHPVTLLQPVDNYALFRTLNEVPLPAVSMEANTGDIAVPPPAEIKHGSPVVGRIQNAINRFFGSMNKTDILPGPNRINVLEKPVNAVKPFFRKYLSNKFDSPDIAMPGEPSLQAYESDLKMENPFIPQVTGLPGDSSDTLLPVMASLPEYSTYETISSVQQDIASEIGMSLPFVDSNPVISPAFAFNSPVSVSAPYIPASFTAAPGNVAQGTGIPQSAGSSPAYLAMAPLLRSMPAELALRPMPEELRDTEATESAEETTTEQREPAYDPEVVATEVYAIIKRRLLVEKERARGSV